MVRKQLKYSYFGITHLHMCMTVGYCMCVCVRVCVCAHACARLET